MHQRTRGLDEMEQIILGILECQAERVGSVAAQGEMWQQVWVTEESRRRSSELRVLVCQVGDVSHMRSGTWQRTLPLPQAFTTR